MADPRKPRRRSRRDLDALADGTTDGTPLGDFVSEMRSMGARGGVEANQSLTEFVSAPRREPDLVVASTTSPKARNPMIAQLTALAATTVGKVALTGGIAAAAVGGAVVVNELQEPGPDEVVASAADTTSTTTSAASPGDDGESAPVGSSTHAVLDAGSVTVAVDGLSVSVVSADPNPGWTAEIETDEPGEAQVNFRNGAARVDFRAEIEDGQLRIRIRDRRTDTESETFPDNDDPTTTDDDGESAPVGSSTHAVLDAGSVTVAVDGLSVSVVSADPNPGWTAEIETDEPGEAQVNFRNGAARVDFRAEIEDGQLRIRIRDRRTDTESETFPGSDDPATTPDDDDDDDGDRSGSSSGSDDDHDDDDRSGSGSDSDDDDDHDDDDRSGSGSDSDDDDDHDDDDDDRSGSNSGSG